MRAAWLMAGAVMLGPAGCERAGGTADEEVPVQDSRPPAAPRPQWPAWAPVPWPAGDDGLERALVAAELDRDPQAEAIERAWHHEDPAWRARSAWTLARIGGPVARERLSERLGDGRIELDASTLGAIALLDAPSGGDEQPRDGAWDELVDRLWTRSAVPEDAAEADALLLAIARVGGERSPARLAADLSALPQPGERGRYEHGMEALAILCARGHALTVEGVEAVAQGLAGAGPRGRGAAAYALSRCAAISAELLAGQERGELVERLAPMVGADDAEGARRAWWALEGLGELPRVIPATILGPSEHDWMTEVAAVKALASHADGRKVVARRLAKVELAGFVGPRLHVLRSLLEGLRPFAAAEPELEPPLRSLLTTLDEARGRASAQPLRAKALTLLACEVRLLLATRSGDTSELSRCASDSSPIPEHHGDRLVIEAWIHMGTTRTPEQRVAALLELAVDSRPAVRAPAVAALAGLDDLRIAAALREALADDDMGVVASAAGAIGSRASDRSRRDPTAVEPLLSAMRRFDDDSAVETRIAAIDALGRLARTALSAGAEPSSMPWLRTELAPLGRDPRVAVRSAARGALRGQASLLAELDEQVPQGVFSPEVHQAPERFGGGVPGLRLHTDAGIITIETRGAPAPIAQASLAALAERGFFDGLSFHRVVPGFVVQGGDPRGDGYGGPGYVMPCEWSTLRYERGTVGIALAGKDTGGSQLFIAHEAPRHLDARYSVIGRVVEGLDVVDAIWPYDRITRVEVLPTPPVSAGPLP
ncbi:MAG: peptidylprolyl isomerase [Nannocystaceae bacterium]